MILIMIQNLKWVQIHIKKKKYFSRVQKTSEVNNKKTKININALKLILNVSALSSSP
jgi:hypothetical protein